MISVCMATYNGGLYIKEQIDSIIMQLSKDDELIISDDGSRDGTIEIINSFHDIRIKLYHNETNHGFVGNFENALSQAKGDYIFLSDQDDIWKEGKIKVTLDALKNYDLVVHNAELIDGSGNSLNKDYYSCLHQKTTFLANLWKTRFLGCCMAFNRKVFQDCIPFPQKIVAHDYWIGMYALAKYKVAFIPNILISYRRHGNNVSPSSEKSNNSLFYKVFTKRVSILLSIINRFLNV